MIGPLYLPAWFLAQILNLGSAHKNIFFNPGKMGRAVLLSPFPETKLSVLKQSMPTKISSSRVLENQTAGHPREPDCWDLIQPRAPYNKQLLRH